MRAEYLVLGIILILMGGVQIWLRHVLRPKPGDDGPGAQGERARVAGAGRIRSGRAWEAWTAILGFVGVAVGIALVVIGVLGE